MHKYDFNLLFGPAELDTLLQRFNPETQTLDEYRAQLVDSVCFGKGVKELYDITEPFPYLGSEDTPEELNDLFAFYGVRGLDPDEVVCAMDTVGELCSVLAEILDGSRPPVNAAKSH